MRRLLGKGTLLIIDNADIAPGDDPGLQDLLSLQCDILVTSRTDFTAVFDHGCTSIEVGRMRDESLQRLFKNIAGTQADDEQDAEALSGFINRIDGHTMLTELFAKQIKASGIDVSELYKRYEGSLYSLSGMEKIQTVKDGTLAKGELPLLV